MIFYDKTNICGRYLQIDYEKKLALDLKVYFFTINWFVAIFLF